ncbi:unnamed protein product, partial [Ectocarpus sp. 13 AM-2016]
LGTLLVKPCLAYLLIVCSIWPNPGAVSSSLQVYVRWVPSHFYCRCSMLTSHPIFFR